MRYTFGISDEILQMKVDEELRNIYYYHLKIIRIAKEISESYRVRFCGGFLQLYGVCYIPMIMTFKPLLHQIEMVMVFTVAFVFYVVTLVVFYDMGQAYEDKISAIYDALHNVDWYTWSSKNRKVYILLLERIPVTESLAISLNEKVNRNFLIKYVSLLAKVKFLANIIRISDVFQDLLYNEQFGSHF
ncbi:hypothetical protein GWI33_013381 [Rhynchophorus ferrugineus]|uniref:Odorant receptor n=1 Tax=Rhynchophorus ferrugineus TaxID=354439 RepID=A0A834I3I3_RHYFE|nr:hypothetical protein GWI33_013381 [Rhynchophorus ferrugineus]